MSRLPFGYIALRPADGNFALQSILSNPFVAGVELRDRWCTVNPSAGVFNFSRLLNYAEQVLRFNKVFSLVLLTGTSSPPWIYKAGAKKVSVKKGKYDPSDAMPLPWDLTMLRFHDQLVAEAAARFNGMGHLVKVNISGPTQSSLEMHMDAKVMSTKNAGLLLTGAWKQAIDSYDQYFTNVGCSLNLATPGDVQKLGVMVMKDVSNYACHQLGKGRAVFQYDGYNSKPDAEKFVVYQHLLELSKAGYHCGIEQVSDSGNTERYGKAGFLASVERARKNGWKFFDYYDNDSARIKAAFI